MIAIAGASGSLGGRLARRLLAQGHGVRAVGRRESALRPLEERGAEILAGDLRDPSFAASVCAGITDLVSTANNVMGSGPSSPGRVDLPMYRCLAECARKDGVERWVHVSALGVGPDNPVDYFRIKHAVDGVVRESGVPWVLVQPSAFMDTWVDRILGAEIREKGSATLFGGGTTPANFVAEDDVAAVLAAIVADPSVRNETIPVGGPSTLTAAEVVDRIEAAWGLTVRRKSLPVPVMGMMRRLVAPFNERLGRQISLGYWSATTPVPCPGWRDTARRFGVEPRTVEDYLEEPGPS